MLDLDQWQEIFATMRKNKLRTFLTGFSVAWGIFMLVLLMGAGNGLAKGVMHNFSDSKNSIWMWGGQTSMAHEGYNSGRQIQLTNQDYEMVGKKYKDIEDLSARARIRGAGPVSYKNNYGDFEVMAIHPGHQKAEALLLISGRLLNKFDIDEYRKSAVIGTGMRDQLFKDEDPIGKYVLMGGIKFLVVGVFGDVHEGETRRMYVPISMAQKTFIEKNRIGLLTFISPNTTEAETDAMIEDIKQSLSRKYNFNPEDNRALGSFNAMKEFRQMQAVFNGINLFVLVIGIFTIIAGIVGVSNIMLIVVKERTKEIGIRKALGAKPASIILMILEESILVTSIAGYIGLVLGLILVEGIASVMPASDFFREPGVNFNMAIGATLMIVVAGAIAGYIPARKAANIRPVVALHDE